MTSSPRPPAPPMLRNLHLLRAFAALSVVYFHITSTAGLGLAWDIGSRGVDVFFVISGFVIAWIGAQRPGPFFVRRLIRIVPFYWAATLVVFAAANALPQLFRSTDASLPHLLASLLFVPHLSASGETQPTLILGWSLNFEMYFYALFALALWLSPRRAPLLCAVAIVAWVLVAHAIGPISTAADFYARPTSLEFCYGIAAYYLVAWCERNKPRLERSAVLRTGLVLALVAGIAALVFFEKQSRDALPRYLVAGLPAFAIVVSALLLERLHGIASRSRPAYLLGEASYVIYLIHPYIAFGLLRLCIRHPQQLSTPATVAVVLGLMALIAAVGIVIHLLFEKPVMRALRARFAPEPPRAALAPPPAPSRLPTSP